MMIEKDVIICMMIEKDIIISEDKSILLGDEAYDYAHLADF